MTTVLEIQRPHLTYCKELDGHCECPKCNNNKNKKCNRCKSCQKYHKEISNKIILSQNKNIKIYQTVLSCATLKS